MELLMMQIDGQWHCGKITYTAVVDPAEVYVCYCTVCQNLTGSPYRVTVRTECEFVTIVGGAPKSGHIYITGAGTNPALRNNLDDPALFAHVPSLGACMPNIRRFVVPGDYVFVISGKVPNTDQYLIGGFRVRDKVSAVEAPSSSTGLSFGELHQAMGKAIGA
jgi:hypothetical protein